MPFKQLCDRRMDQRMDEPTDGLTDRRTLKLLIVLHSTRPNTTAKMRFEIPEGICFAISTQTRNGIISLFS